MAEQCAGLADGLSGIHCARMPLEELKNLDGYQPQGQRRSAASTAGGAGKTNDEKDYGRHGDIKPHNILWFRNEQNDWGHGVLKITDFGLATFHREHTTNQDGIHNLKGTNTYVPPEITSGDTVSRSFDNWSLGCVYLEFIVWATLGGQGVQDFAGKRQAEVNTVYRGYGDDSFFKPIKPLRRKAAKVKALKGDQPEEDQPEENQPEGNQAQKPGVRIKTAVLKVSDPCCTPLHFRVNKKILELITAKHSKLNIAGRAQDATNSSMTSSPTCVTAYSSLIHRSVRLPCKSEKRLKRCTKNARRTPIIVPRN